MGSPMMFFGGVRQKIFDRKSWYPTLMHKVFRYQKTSETQKGSPTGFFGIMRQKNFPRRIVIPPTSPPPLSCMTFFDTWISLKYRRFPCEDFRYCETKSIRQKIEIPPPPLSFIYKIFWYQKFSETEKGSPTKFFGTIRQKKFDEKWWYPLLILSLLHKILKSMVELMFVENLRKLNSKQ